MTNLPELQQRESIQYAWKCEDCGFTGNSGSYCAKCCSMAVWPVDKVLDREEEKGTPA